jgi:hypothetical protein
VIRRNLVAAVLLTGLAAAQWAIAQPATTISSLGFDLGDDVARVQAALHTNARPFRFEKTPPFLPYFPGANRGMMALHLRGRGIWVFFGEDGVVQAIRLEAPFSGDVLGVKLDDMISQVRGKLGQATYAPFPAVGTLKAYRYMLDKSTFVEFDVNEDMEVKVISISK